jgi:fatty-acyl-CoA synthase
MDEDGFIYIADRIKDMIISGGENIYPAEVEEALFDHPAVAEVAVVGTPDERFGEGVCAVVVPRPGSSVDLEELREHAGQRIGRYKLPRRLEILDELPRNASGKVLKTELRKRYNTAL